MLKESDDLLIPRFQDILRITFVSKMTFEKHLLSVSRAASQRFGTLRKSWGVFHERSLLERCCRGVCPARFGVLFCSVLLGCRYHFKLLDRVVSAASFLTGGVLQCDIALRRSVALLQEYAV